MKILFLNFVARTGSTGKIINDVVAGLNDRGVKNKTFYGRKPVVKDPNCNKFCTEFEAQFQNVFLRIGLTLEYGGNYFATLRLKRLLKKYNPTIVHIHCLNGSCVNVFSLLSFLARKGYKTIVTHHAEFYYTGVCPHAFDCLEFTNIPGCMHCPDPYRATKAKLCPKPEKSWKKMFDSFSLFDKDKLIFTAVSPWVKERSLLSPIVNSFRTVVIENGVDTSVFNYCPNEDLIKAICKEKKKTIIHVTAGFNPERRDDNKGGAYVVKLAELLPQYNFIVVASFASFKQLPSNMFFYGRTVNQKELAQIYSSCDITLITSKRETFSMVCAESLCCGTPVIGFKAGGPETIGLLDYTSFVEYDDITALHEAILKAMNVSFDKKTISEKARGKYSNEKMVDNYISLYESFSI